MRIVSVNSWGFLLEHEQEAYFIPARPQIANMMVRQEVKVNEKQVLVIAAGDLPFVVRNKDPFHSGSKEDPLVEFVSEKSPEATIIKIAMVEFARTRR